LTNGIISTSSTSPLVSRRSTPRTDPIRTGPIQAVTTPTLAVPVTRRAARAADRAEVKAKRPGTKKTAISVAVMTLTAGLFGTMALPAFAHTPDSTATGSSASTAALNSVRANGAQSVAVAGSINDASVSRDNYTTTVPVVHVVPTVTTATTLSATQTTAAVAKRASFAASTAYAGKTASDYLSSASHPAFSLAAVYQTALQYVGTPYVFGGSTPSGFDCSGFVMFVYAQYGISLAHSVPLQSAAGTTISQADAEPGDIVVLNNGSHDGFYAGNGMILDAPKPGGAVSVRKLWTTDVHFVRFGIK
jgi:cell wall-associated NlpC family hydrolase